MENSFYYTFSTIAQVLAGFLALSGVFVLFQFNRYVDLQKAIIKSFIEDYLAKYRISPEFIRKLTDAINLGDYSLTPKILIDFSADVFIKPLGDLSSIAKHYADKVTLFQRKKFILLSLTKISVLIGVIIILYSLLILANVPSIINSHIGCKLLFFTIGIVGATICLSTMAYVIFISLNVNPK